MKKVLALVLAVMMMSTFAFAITAHIPETGLYHPGEKIWLDHSNFENLTSPTDIVTDDFTVNGISWTKGRTLVDSVKIDDDEKAVAITLKKNYTLEKDTALEGTVKIRNKDDRKVYSAVVNTKVNNIVEKEEIKLADTKDEISITTKNYTLYVVDAKQGYGALNFSSEVADFEVNGRVYDGEKLYLHSNATVNKDVLLANEDVDADIDFLNFVAKPTFKALQTVSLFIDEDMKVYENKDGKLTEIKGKYDKETGAFTFTTRTLGNYVWADKALKSVAGSTAPSEGNPDTGANDVVGIATALAAVALVSAAAISLKK